MMCRPIYFFAAIRLRVACVLCAVLCSGHARSVRAADGAGVIATEGWGLDSAAWGEVQTDPRATLISGTAPDEPLSDSAEQPFAAGDLNGDGCADLVLARPGSSSTPGEVRIYYGTGQGWETTGVACAPLLTQQSVLEVEPADDGAYERLGLSMAVADVTGEGIDDLVISSGGPLTQQSCDGTLRTFYPGRVYVFPGGTAGVGDAATLTPADARVRLEGTCDDWYVGYFVAAAGDLSGDGVGDLWIANNINPGKRVFLWEGSSAWLVPRPSTELVRSDDASTGFLEVSGSSTSTSRFGARMVTQHIGAETWLVVSDPGASVSSSTAPPADGIVYRVPLDLEAGTHGSVEDPETVTFPAESGTAGEAGRELMVQPGTEEAALWIAAPAWGTYDPYADTPYQGQLTRADGTALVIRDVDQPVNAGTRGLGSAMQVLEDLDAQGGRELAIGSEGRCAPRYNETDPLEPGRVILLRGDELEAGAFEGQQPLINADGSTELPARFGWDWQTDGDCFGYALATGDFNGDGKQDLAVLAPQADNGAGEAVVLWSIEDLFDRDGDGALAYAGIPWGDTLIDGAGAAWLGGDCNDADPLIGPQTAEDCNGKDDDCDGEVDEGVLEPFYIDADGDGYTAPRARGTNYTYACAPEPGMAAVSDEEDCDDGCALTHPGADEICDGRDNDCDAAVVCADPSSLCMEALAAEERDADGDGAVSCPEPADGSSCSSSARAYDCDDQDPKRFVGNLEACDGVDNDCDGSLPACEQDGDGDGECPYEGDCDDTRADRFTPYQRADGTWVYPDVKVGDDPEDLDCNDDDYSSCLFKRRPSSDTGSGCLAIRTRSAPAMMLPALMRLFLLRRRSRRSEKGRAG